MNIIEEVLIMSNFVEVIIFAVLITVDGKFGNVHGVPEEKVQQMRDRFEHLTLEDFEL